MALQLTREPRTPDELHALVRTVFGYTIPRHKVCDDHDAPFDAFCAAFFRHDPQVLILGSRGLSGKTRLMSVLGMTFALVEGSGVTVLGGSFFQSKNVHDTMQKIIDHPGFNKGWLAAEPTASMIALQNKAVIRPITASQRSARGLHEPILLGDEIDEMDEEIWESAKGQPMPQINYRGEKKYQQTVMASTLQYPDKTMKHEMDRMREQDLPTFSWCVASGTLVETDRGRVPIESVTTEDRVLTRQGYRKVLQVIDQGYKPTVEVVHEQGAIRVTDDHELWTLGRGWVAARHVVAGAAHPMPAVGTDVGVLGRELVAAGTVSGPAHEGPAPVRVLASRDGFQVRQIDAESVTAQMVDVEPLGQGADELLPHDPVGIGTGSGSPVTRAHQGVALSGAVGPVDALLGLVDQGLEVQSRGLVDVGAALAADGTAGLEDGAAVEARWHGLTVHQVVPTGLHEHVWDLTVESVHEFVAGGVLVHNCYKDVANPIDGWLDQQTIDMKRREVGSERWRVEYDLGEPSIGNRAFNTPDVDEMFIKMDSDRAAELWPITDPAEFTLRQTKDFQEYHFEDYRQDRDYVISADWAKEQDWTVITVTDATYLPAKVVHWVRFHHLSWPTMVGRYNKLLNDYRCGYNAIHDGTGVGNVINDMVDERAHGFLMTGEKRDNMLYDFIVAVERHLIVAPRVRDFYEAVKFASTEMLFARGKEFHLPDEVCSMALGWHKIDGMAPASINFEALARDKGESPFEVSISENKQPHRAQEFDNQKGKRDTEPGISFVG